MKATKRKSKKKSRSAKRSPVAAKRSRPAGAATTATKASPPAASSASPSAPPSTSTSASAPSAPPRVDKAAARRTLFVAAYLANGGNATEAAKSAGFSEKTACSQGSRLLRNVEVAAAVTAAQVKLQHKHHLTADRVLQELARITFFDPRKLYNPDGTLKKLHDLDDDTAAAIASVELEGGVISKLKGWDKNSAIEKAMRTLGQFKHDFTPQIPGAPGPSTPVNVNVTLNPSDALMRLLGR